MRAYLTGLPVFTVYVYQKINDKFLLQADNGNNSIFNNNPSQNNNNPDTLIHNNININKNNNN